MEHFGKIIDVEGELARVQIARTPECKSCRACEMFDTRKTVEIVARNNVNAQLGDQVNVEIAPAHVVGSSLLIFLFPIVALLVGYWLGVNLASQLGLNQEGGGIIGAITLLVLAFIIIYFYDRFFARRQKTRAEVIAICK